MAIELNLDRDKNEIKAVLPKAYLKIIDVEIRASTEEAWVKFVVFADKTARDNPESCSVVKRTVKCSLGELTPEAFDKAGIFTAAYKILKGYSDYQGINV